MKGDKRGCPQDGHCGYHQGDFQINPQTMFPRILFGEQDLSFILPLQEARHQVENGEDSKKGELKRDIEKGRRGE
jgi:hypothetical protein